MLVRPVISICIANYNGLDVIDDCIQSIHQQMGSVAYEILIHDDASSDGSVAHIRTHYPEAQLIESNSNVGFCVANNRMAAIAQGEYLLLLNNDAALYPDALQTLLQEARRLEQPAILTLPQYDATSGALVDRGCLLDPFYNPVPNLNPNRTDVAMVIGACLWIPKSLWDELGGFPEWFESIAEDMYLCCRARLAGYAVRALAVSGYRHWQGKSFGGGKVADGRLATTFRRRALSERNKTFVLAMMTPTALMMLVTPMHFAVLYLEGFLVTLLKRNADVWRIIYKPVIPALWRHRAKLLNLRRKVQRCRRLGLREWLQAFVPVPHKIGAFLRHGIPDIR